jgi:hypothetical protein
VVSLHSLRSQHGDAWVQKVNSKTNFTMEHLTQFINLWIFLLDVNLVETVDDTIYWKLTSNGQYFVVSAYKLQFLELVYSSMKNTILKVKTMLGLRFKMDFRWRIEYKIEVGLIVNYVFSANYRIHRSYFH